MERVELLQELRWMTGLVLASGADPQRVSRIADELVELLLAGRGPDPRTARTTRLASRVARAHAAGVSVPDLMERFRLSRATVYRLLDVSRLRETHARSNAASAESGD